MGEQLAKNAYLNIFVSYSWSHFIKNIHNQLFKKNFIINVIILEVKLPQKEQVATLHEPI